MAVIQITAAQFEKEVIQSDKPVVVDFWADWCVPCKRLSPVLEEVSEEVKDVKFVGLEAGDDAEDLCMHHGISNIPCLVLFKGGQEVDRSVGFIQKDRIKEFIAQ